MAAPYQRKPSNSFGWPFSTAAIQPGAHSGSLSLGIKLDILTLLTPSPLDL